MKIITPGNSPFRKRCNRCGCVFEYENSDLHMVETEFDDFYSCVTCPTCHEDIHAKRVESISKKNNGLEDFEGYL